MICRRFEMALDRKGQGGKVCGTEKVKGKNREPSCVRICVRKTFQNQLKLEKIGKSLENYI
jgi:hypothetical protein